MARNRVYPVSLAFILAALFSGLPRVAHAQNTPAPGPNSDGTYQALRNITVGGEAVTVSDLKFKRDAGTFVLHSGVVCFVPAVNGKVTGAVFSGDGGFAMTPPTESERKSLRYLSKEDEFNEKFDKMVMRFTDGTYEEIKMAGTPASGGCEAGALKDSQNTTRHRLRTNLEARLLEEVLSPLPRGFFVAFIHGKHYDDKELFQIEPNSNRDQVSFLTYDDNKWGEWASFNYTETHEKGSYGQGFLIEHQALDTTLEKNANLIGKATTMIVARRDGLRVVQFDLFAPLRVQSVTVDGQAVSFIQENKNDDADFAVILPKALSAGEKVSITTNYAGKEAVSNEGGGNYFPVARDDWYPNMANGGLGEYTPYDMTFRIPKGMTMAATGIRLSDTNDGGQNVTVWKSESPQTVAGFSFGRFKTEQAKISNPEYTIESLANDESPNWVKSLQDAATGNDLERGPGNPNRVGGQSQMTLGTMSTTGLNKKALAEGELAVQLYSDYFGASQFKHMQLTQQTACSFGQSWPELVWIPICYYFDTTVRHQLGMDWGDRGYWKVVTPHEVAHQWWGHTVGFSSIRDQWMSEGFADMSASLYLSMIEKDQKKFITFWNDERDLLVEKNAQGFRAIDVGPLTMGYRTSNSRVGGGVTRRLIYPKGAYVLHMLRMMMRDPGTGDKRFKEMMHDFVDTYRGKAVTTEDFKAVVEKHMTPDMDVDGNKKMDWFFNEYVYGTQLPTQRLEYGNFDIGSDGDVVMSIKVTQSNVDDKFRMVVPIYIETAEGKIAFLGRLRLAGNSAFEQKVTLKGLKTKPKRAIVNYFDDVLALPN